MSVLEILPRHRAAQRHWYLNDGYRIDASRIFGLCLKHWKFLSAKIPKSHRKRIVKARGKTWSELEGQNFNCG